MAEPASISNKLPPYLVEAVCACLIEQGVMIENMTITNKGAFKKAFSWDISAFSIEEIKGTFKASININRDGLYDILPEGLFHQTRGMNLVRTVRDAVEEHKKFKEEEKHARKFFAPLEEMILRYRVLAELSERNALYHVENKQFTNNLLAFWNIDNSLPVSESLRMAMTMPYLCNIKGDRCQTEAALSFILNKDVNIEEVEKRSLAQHDQLLSLNNMSLGVNSVLGNNSNEIIYGWLITIQGINEVELGQFIPDAPMDRLLNRFSEIFIPMDRDIYFDFNLDEDNAKQDMSYVLGYGCTI